MSAEAPHPQPAAPPKAGAWRLVELERPFVTGFFMALGAIAAVAMVISVTVILSVIFGTALLSQIAEGF